MMHTFIVLLIWIQPLGTPTCTKFAIAAVDQEQAIEMAHADIDTIPDIVGSIKLEPIRLDKPVILVEGNFTGDMCNFRRETDGSSSDD